MAAGIYEAIVIGTSAGGSAALKEILPELPKDYNLPVIIVQHMHPLQAGPAIIHNCTECALEVKEAEEKESVQPGYVYFAPANYHLLIEDDRSFALSIDEKVNYTRPSIDVLFESAADVYGSRLIGIILSGANNDGVAGMLRIKRSGGLVIVQDPDTADAPFMPNAVLEAISVDYKLAPRSIGHLLKEFLAVTE